MMQIQVLGLNKLNGFLSGLPRNLRNEISKESGQFMKDVKKSAKLRAPRDTRELTNSIILTEKGKGTWVLSVESPHGVFQEEGFRPHWIHTSMIIGSNKFEQIYGGRDKFIFVKKSKPFVRPALEHNLNKLAQRMGNATNLAVNKSKGSIH